MSAVSHRWFSFFLLTSLLVSVCLADVSKDISVNATDEFVDGHVDDEDPARKAFRLKDTFMDLCQNLPGCTCDGKHERANCSCIINDKDKLKKIDFNQVKIPMTIVKLNIVDCPFVDIAQTKLADLPIKSLNVLRVKHLHIGSASLKQVDRLNLENIGKLDYDKDALVELVADTVTFVNVTFPVGAELVPLSIKSELKIVQCNLTDFTIILDSPQTDRSVSISHSYLNRLSLKINAGTFAMDSNQFVQLSSKSAGLMDIMYSHSIDLKNNRFGMNSSISILPDVMSCNQSLVFHATHFTAVSKEWLGHFGLKFTGATQSGVTGKSLGSSREDCDVQNAPDSTSNRIIMCPNVKSLGEFLKTETKDVTAQARVDHQPEKQKQIQTHDDIKALGVAVTQHYPILVLAIAVGVMLCTTSITLHCTKS